MTFRMIIFFLGIVSGALAENVVLQYDNGIPDDSHSGSQYSGFEESCILKPDGPCVIKKIHIFLTGATAKTDSLYILQDPCEGGIPPTKFVRHFSQRIAPVAIEYSGAPGWYEINMFGKGLRSDGLDRIIIQHDISSKGPWVVYDSDDQDSYVNSFLCDVNTPNPDFYDLKGTLFYRAKGNFLIRLELEYDFPDGESSTAPPFPSLYDISKTAGITDTNGASISNAQASVTDWNGDGFDDIAIGSRFFQNNDDGTFKNVSKSFNIVARSTAWADYNNDGIMDCFANNGGANDNFTVYDQIYTGNGDGTFESDQYNDVLVDAPTVSPLWLDYDSDGLADLFIAYGRTSVNSVETYFQDKLFRNVGGGKFDEVTNEAKISRGEPSPYYDCWSASICDYNNDQKPDIFVATYRLAPDLLYKNNGDGTFEEVGSQTGAKGIKTFATGAYGHGMGSDWGDFNNDGYDDLCVGNLAHPDERGASSNPSLIFKNNHDENFTFEEVHQEMGLKYFEMNAGAVWADLDLDGYLDLFHCQYSYDKKDSGIDRFSHVYINKGPEENYKLDDKTWHFGPIIHGAWSPVRLDFDNDGDLDLLVASDKEFVKLFRNDIERKGNWAAFSLTGAPEENICMDAFGTKVTVVCSNKSYVRSLPGSVNNARTSQSSHELHFGLGENETIDKVIVDYPNGKSFEVTNLAVNRKYNLEYNGVCNPLPIATQALKYPTNHSILNEINPLLKWHKSAGVEYFQVQVQKAAEEGFGNPILDINYYSEQEIRTSALEEYSQYKWRVRAFGEGKYTPWSSEWYFITGEMLLAYDLPPAIRNAVCVPNPIDEIGYIEFTLSENNQTDINIYDIHGRKMQELFSGYLESGPQKICFSTGLNPGVYFVRIDTGEFDRIVRVVVI